jgi:hypothetical protein
MPIEYTAAYELLLLLNREGGAYEAWVNKDAEGRDRFREFDANVYV